MTCCIAIQCRDGVLLAADTAVTWGTARYDRAPTKLFQHPRLYEAFTGGGNAGRIQRMFREWCDLSDGVEGLQRLARESDRPEDNGLDLLWSDGKDMVRIDRSGGVHLPLSLWMAAGCGADIAFGWLGARLGGLADPTPQFVNGKPAGTAYDSAMPNLDDAERLALDCLAFVARYDTMVAAPFEVLRLSAQEGSGSE